MTFNDRFKNKEETDLRLKEISSQINYWAIPDNAKIAYVNRSVR